MIPRYEKTQISKIWSEENKFKTYLKVELAILKALEGDKIPKGTADYIQKNAKINPKRINEIENQVHHDIIAFCSSITENLNAKYTKFFHFGVTSSDIIDTSLTLQIKDSLSIILKSLNELCETIFNRATEMKTVVTMGRSHGMYAEPLSFGQKLLGFHCEFTRRLSDLQLFFDNELTGQFSGAVGNYTILTPAQEQQALTALDLKVEPVSTQVIPRDHIAKLISINALIANAIERFAVEIRHLHRSEVSELHEGFKKGQKGSSTMPHKKNPISGENLTGLARLVRSHLTMALENSVLWHERDISHSSSERMYLPDNLGILLYIIERLNNTVNNLVFHPETIEGRVKDNFSYLSSFYLHHLIENSNLPREDLYKIIQTAAFESSNASAETFHQKVSELSAKQGISLKDLPLPSFDEIKKMYLKHVDTIFSRCHAPFVSQLLNKKRKGTSPRRF